MRKTSLDFLKIIMAFLVVCIHIDAYFLKDFLVPIARIGVPIFFMLSGYFIFAKNDTVMSIKKQRNKIFKIIIWANLFYFIISIALNFMNGNAIQYLTQTFTLSNLFQIVFLNFSPFSDHLWYLNALLYVLILVGFTESRKVTSKLIYLIPILLLIDLIFGKYSLAIFHQEYSYLFVRNFLFVGLPYFLLGSLFHKFQDIHLKKDWHYYILIIFFIGTTFIEKYSLIYFNVNATREHFISTTLLSIILFSFALKKGDSFKNEKVIQISQKYTLLTYIFHPFIITGYDITLKRLPNIFSTGYYYIAPFLVFISTLLFIKIMNQLKSYLKKRNKQKT